MSVPQDDPSPAYSVEEKDDKHRVVDRSGRTILQCAGAQNAMHNATLINQAFEFGYKDGYREANKSKVYVLTPAPRHKSRARC